MEEMLREFEEELSSCQSMMKSFKTSMREFKSTVSTEVSATQTYDHVIKKGQTHTFSRAERFKEKEKEKEGELGEIAAAMQEFLSCSAYDAIKRKQPAAFISGTQRFPKEEKEEMEEINPKYDAVRRKQPEVVIMPEHKKVERSTEESGMYEDAETEASVSRLVGPGKYDVKYVETQRSAAFSRQARFPNAKQDEMSEIHPNYDAVKRRVQTAVIGKKSEKTKQLLLKEEIEEMGEKLRAEEYRRRPLEMDRAIRPSQPQTVIRKSHKEIMSHPPGSRMRRFLILKLLDELKSRSGLGPGAYEVAQPQREPCMVVLKSHSSERRVPKGEKAVPGPDYYYSKDDYIRPDPIQVAFGKEERIKKTRKEDLDMRKIEPNYDFVKPAVPGGVINPEQQHRALVPPEDELVKRRLGPGYYEQKHGAVEPRTDVGAVKYQDISGKHDRVQQMDPVRNIEFHDYGEILYPDLEVRVRVGYPRIGDQSAQAGVQVPRGHAAPPGARAGQGALPGEAPVLRRQPGRGQGEGGQDGHPSGGQEGQGAGGVPALRGGPQHVQEAHGPPAEDARAGPVPGQLQAARQGPQGRRLRQDNDPIEKPEGAVDGDNLMLDPQLPKKHLANVDFDRMADRPDQFQPKQDHQGELVIQPNYEPVKPRIKKVLDFDKQLDRPAPPEPKHTELLVQPQFTHVEKRVKGNLDFERHPGRDDDPRYLHKQDDRGLVVDPKDVKPKVKTAVKMSAKGSRFPPKSDNDKNPLPPPANVSKIEKAERAIRPNVPAVNMKNQSGRKSLSLQKKK